jgi:membrane protein DedA with SNARE-associated domain
VLRPLADGSATMGGLWAYVAVFLLVAIGWAGVPAIGGAVIAGAAVLASQGKLDFGGVLVVSILATEAGGLAGYAVGIRWGRAMLNHPGPWLDRRQRALSAGEVLYAKWGRLAVFFTPVLVSGIVRMKYSQFVIWNLIAGAVYVLSVGPAAYGAGKVTSGDASLGDVGTLIGGVAVGVAAFLLARRYYRRHKARRASGEGHRGPAGHRRAARPPTPTGPTPTGPTPAGQAPSPAPDEES